MVYSEFHGILTCTLVIRSDTTKVRSAANEISQGSCHGSSWLLTLHQPMMTNPIHNKVDTPGLYEISNQDPFYDEADRVAEYSYIAATNNIVWRCHTIPVLNSNHTLPSVPAEDEFEWGNNTGYAHYSSEWLK